MSHATLRWAVPNRFIGRIVDAEASSRRWSAESIPLAPLGAVALALAYYLAASIGFAFRVPGAPQSVMWLPNSLLLAAALIAAPRLWPVLLASAFPAHMLVAWQAGAPLPTVALLYLTNCLDAVLAATVVRLSVRGQWRMDGLSSLFVFLALGATIGPLLVSFLDAGISTWMGYGDDYWISYRRRLRANTLTNIIVVPAVVGAIHSILRGAVPRPRRTAEAVAVFSALLLL
jgi:integral membrane sensor domain MASE1